MAKKRQKQAIGIFQKYHWQKAKRLKSLQLIINQLRTKKVLVIFNCASNLPECKRILNDFQPIIMPSPIFICQPATPIPSSLFAPQK
jgi:hypothetical protein